MRTPYLIHILILFAVGFTFSCNSSDKPVEKEKPLDTMTKGEITIGVDNQFQPIIEAELSAFHNIYDKAKISAEYKPESQAFEDLLNGKVRLIVASRYLTDEEKALFEKQTIKPDINKIANGAVAILINKENPHAQLTRAQLVSIVSGETKTWQDFSEGSPIMENDGKITLVVDHAGSGSLRYLMDEVLQNGTAPKNLFSAGSNQEVIEYVRQNKGAMGVIGVNWVSDRDESFVDSAFTQVSLVAMEQEDSTGKGTGEFFQPYQSYIADKSYPFLRDVLTISREARAGLGTGFVAFIAGDKGQRVILKSGLYPEFMPPRLVKFPSVEEATDINDFIKENAKDENEEENTK